MLEGEIRELRTRLHAERLENSRLMAENAKLQSLCERAERGQSASGGAYEEELWREVKSLRIERVQLEVRLRLAEERLEHRESQWQAEAEAAKDELNRRHGSERQKLISALHKQAKECDAKQDEVDVKKTELDKERAVAGNARAQVSDPPPHRSRARARA